MKETTQAPADVSSGEEHGARSDKHTRLNVNVTASTRAALDRVVSREGVTVTEALRRLVSYGDMVYRATRINDAELLIRRGDAVERIVVV